MQAKMDPRTGLALLALSNVIAFIQDSLRVELGWIAALAVMTAALGRRKSAVKWLAGFGCLLIFQQRVLPAAPRMIAVSFSIFVHYARWMFPCLMTGSLMLHTISFRQMIAGLRALHIPQKLIVSISVTLRYFPAIREEAGYIRDAMRLRNIRGLERAEALAVPLMISAAGTAEELSAAAVARGIENPVKKTGMVRLRMTWKDWCMIGAGLIFAAAAVWL